MSYPPTLNESLQHVAIIGRYRWLPNATQEERRIALATGTSEEDAVKRIGFELVGGPVVREISGRHFCSFGVTPPRGVEELWPNESDREQLLSLSLAEQKPLLDQLAKGASAQEIGGKLFRELLEDLDGLRPFWSPKFDYNLLLAGYHYLNSSSQQQKRLDARKLRRILFRPEVSIRLLAALRDESAQLKENLKRFEEVLKLALEKEGIQPVAELAAEATQRLHSLRQAFVRDDLPLPAELIPFVTKGDEDDRIPADLGFQWRTFRGHFSGVRKLVDCEPLFALIVVWFFSKVTGEDRRPEEALYEDIYAYHQEAAILGRALRDEDQALFERELDENLQATFELLGLNKREDDKKGDNKWVRLFSQAIVDFVKDVGKKERHPAEVFTRGHLTEWLHEQFARLVPYGIEAGQAIMAELGGLTKELLQTYEKFGGLYGETLTAEILRSKLPAGASKDAHDLWLASCEAAGDSTGQELGDAFRREFNAGMSRLLGEKFHEWLKPQVANDKKDGLKAQLGAISDQYRRQLHLLEEGRGEMTGQALGAVSGVPSTRNPSRVERKPNLQTEAAALDRGQTIAIGAPLSGRPPQPASVDTGPVPTNPPSADPTHLAGTEPPKPPKGPSLYTEIMRAGLPAELKEVFEESRTSLEDVRQRIVETLNVSKTELDQARAFWRALALGETALAGDPTRSALDKRDSSLGVHLLLEMVNHLGRRADAASRTKLADPKQALDADEKKIPLWQIYKVPKDENQAKDDLAEVVAYWQGIADAVMACKAYAQEVVKVKSCLEPILTRARITFYNETVAEHQKRDLVAGLCFASSKHEAPPSWLWITDQALGLGPGAWMEARQTLCQKFEKEVVVFLANQVDGEVFAYPLVIGKEVGGLHGTIDPCAEERPAWGADLALLSFLAALKSDPTKRYTIKGRSIEVASYYLGLTSSFLLPLAVQTRLLSQALFGHAEGSREFQSTLIKLNKDDNTLLRNLLIKQAPAEGRSPWATYSTTQNLSSPVEIGWKNGGNEGEFSPDLVKATAPLQILV